MMAWVFPVAAFAGATAVPAVRPEPRAPVRPAEPAREVSPLVAAARAQVGVTTGYDPAYRRLAYPGGDVPRATGVCADVVVRALRATGLDLQQAVHEDMAKNFTAYPKNWGLKKPDTNIDHRRVPNLATWFTRAGWSLPVSKRAADYAPGDIVTWDIGGGLKHIGVVSDKRTATGEPRVIHNIGAGAAEEAVLFAWPITGRFRKPAGAPATSTR